MAVDQQQAPAERGKMCEPNSKHVSTSTRRTGEAQGVDSLTVTSIISGLDMPASQSKPGA